MAGAAALSDAASSPRQERSGEPGPRQASAYPAVPDSGVAASGMTWNAAAVRAQFPILSRSVNGRPLTYLDSAASAQKPRAVIDAMTAAMEGSYANVHRGLHTLANETTEAFEAARDTAARFLNAPSAEQIVWTKGGTEAINLVAAGLAQSIRPGDEIVVTEMEHHSNIVPWHMLRERHGAVLRWAPIGEDGSLDLEALGGLLNARTRMVAVTHMSNVLGTVNPVARIAEMAHAVGAQILVDGCQGAVHCAPDVQVLGCDFYVMTGHKLYGPTGIGVLYGTAEALEGLPPYQGGGEMIETVTREAVRYAKPPHRFEAGTPPIMEAIGLGAALDWMMAQDRVAGAAHEVRLYQRALAAVEGSGVRVLGEAAGKGAILTFTVDGAHAHDIAQILDRYGVAVRAGLHCAEPLAARFGVSSSVRASFALYNDDADVDAFVEGLARARKFFA